MYEIDLFSLYVSFSQHRSCDNTLKNCVFQISSCSRAYVRKIYEKTKGQVPQGPLLGKKRTTSRGLLLTFSQNSLILSFLSISSEVVCLKTTYLKDFYGKFDMCSDSLKTFNDQELFEVNNNAI